MMPHELEGGSGGVSRLEEDDGEADPLGLKGEEKPSAAVTKAAPPPSSAQVPSSAENAAASNGAAVKPAAAVPAPAPASDALGGDDDDFALIDEEEVLRQTQEMRQQRERQQQQHLPASAAAAPAIAPPAAAPSSSSSAGPSVGAQTAAGSLSAPQPRTQPQQPTSVAPRLPSAALVPNAPSSAVVAPGSAAVAKLAVPDDESVAGRTGELDLDGGLEALDEDLEDLLSGSMQAVLSSQLLTTAGAKNLLVGGAATAGGGASSAGSAGGGGTRRPARASNWRADPHFGAVPPGKVLERDTRFHPHSMPLHRPKGWIGEPSFASATPPMRLPHDPAPGGAGSSGTGASAPALVKTAAPLATAATVAAVLPSSSSFVHPSGTADELDLDQALEELVGSELPVALAVPVTGTKRPSPEGGFNSATSSSSSAPASGANKRPHVIAAASSAASSLNVTAPAQRDPKASQPQQQSFDGLDDLELDVDT